MSPDVVDPDALLLELLATPEGRADPYPRYAAVREAAPVHRSAIGAVVVSRFDDCQTVLRDPRLGKGIQMVSRRMGLSAAQQGEQADVRREHRSLLWLDPPDHTRLRGLVAKAFTPRTVEALRPSVEALADDLLDGIGGEVDLMAAVASPLPVTVIGELLGVPEPDRPKFLPLSRAGTLAFEPSAGPEVVAAANDAQEEMQDYFRDLLERRRSDPGDDLLTHLLQVEESGEVLTAQEVISTAILLFGAGFETTVNLIGNGTLALLRHPDQLDRLREDPGLLRSGVDELLRFDSPVQVDARTVTTELSLDGHVVPVDEVVVALLGSANRDPARYSDPDRLDLARDEGPSLAFGSGIHHCLGAALAKLEGQVVFAKLLERFDTIELLDESPPWRDTITMRGLEELHLRVG
ncbi:MAG: cytochrome P450 [Acidimicrobiia bacterium]|nr:cytochrome P450 [Acidimicrobiia bacterium]